MLNHINLSDGNEKAMGKSSPGMCKGYDQNSCCTKKIGNGQIWSMAKQNKGYRDTHLQATVTKI
jgi:hypothetical protein